MGRLLIVSNRLPVSIEQRKDGLNFRPSAGGLATGLATFHKKEKGIWIGWPGTESVGEEERRVIESRLEKEWRCVPVFLPRSLLQKFYYGFSNRTLWPLLHYFPQYCVYDASEWKAYVEVNEYFCEKVVKLAKRGDAIWVHDYHLMLLPKLIRERLPGATVGFFLHIPFPSMEVFRYLPWREEILEGGLGG